MRWLEPETTIAAVAEPLTEAEARLQCRIDADDAENSAPLPGFIAAARAHVEAKCGIRLYTQTVKLRAWGFDECAFRLPIAPVQSITSVKYLDTDGVEQTLDPATYVAALYGLSPTIALAAGQAWPAHRVQPGSVTFTVVCGYAPNALPGDIKQALLLLVADWNANREQFAFGVVSAVPMVAVESLLINSRRAYV